MNLDLNNFAWDQPPHDRSRPNAGLLVAIIGGGGKNGLLTHWAQELLASGEPALMTATTQMNRCHWPRELTVRADNKAEAMKAAEQALAGERILLVGPERRAGEEKWAGIPRKWLDNLSRACPRLSILVKADSAQGHDFKFHLGYEPIIPARANLVVAVVGLGLLGRSAKKHVQRLELAPNRPETDQVITSSQMAYWLTARNGYVARFLNPGAGLLFLNQAETPETRQAAEYISYRINRLYPQVTIIVGSLRQKKFYRLY